MDDVAGPADRDAAVRRRLVDVGHLGAPEVLATTRITGRIAQRATAGAGASTALVRSLRELQAIVGAMGTGDPDHVDAYLARYARRRGQVDVVLADLADGADALGLAIAARRQEERSLELELASLRRYVVMAGRLDAALEARLDSIALVDASRARRLRNGVLLEVRSRRQELLLHLEVATQALLALRSLAAHDETLRDEVTLVRSTTVAAIDAAALVARLLADRRDRDELGDAFAELRRSWDAASAALASAGASIG